MLYVVLGWDFLSNLRSQAPNFHWITMGFWHLIPNFVWKIPAQKIHNWSQESSWLPLDQEAEYKNVAGTAVLMLNTFTSVFWGGGRKYRVWFIMNHEIMLIMKLLRCSLVICGCIHESEVSDFGMNDYLFENSSWKFVYPLILSPNLKP